MFKNILLCTDGSEHALAAAQCAAELAKSQRACLTMLHVAQPPALPATFAGAPMIAQPVLDQYIRDLHRAVVGRTMPTINALGVFCDILEETGSPAAVIVRIAETRGFDLIVLGSRGLAAERATNLGSVSYAVLHQAHCPVLVVKN